MVRRLAKVEPGLYYPPLAQVLNVTENLLGLSLHPDEGVSLGEESVGIGLHLHQEDPALHSSAARKYLTDLKRNHQILEPAPRFSRLLATFGDQPATLPPYIDTELHLVTVLRARYRAKASPSSRDELLQSLYVLSQALREHSGMRAMAFMYEAVTVARDDLDRKADGFFQLPFALDGLGSFLMERSNYEGACRAYKELVEFFRPGRWPGNEVEWVRLMNIYAPYAKALRVLGRLDEAEEALRAEVYLRRKKYSRLTPAWDHRLHPTTRDSGIECAEALRNLSCVLVELGRRDEAHEFESEGIQLLYWTATRGRPMDYSGGVKGGPQLQLKYSLEGVAEEGIAYEELIEWLAELNEMLVLQEPSEAEEAAGEEINGEGFIIRDWDGFRLQRRAQVYP